MKSCRPCRRTSEWRLAPPPALGCASDAQRLTPSNTSLGQRVSSRCPTELGLEGKSARVRSRVLGVVGPCASSAAVESPSALFKPASSALSGGRAAPPRFRAPDLGPPRNRWRAAPAIRSLKRSLAHAPPATPPPGPNLHAASLGRVPAGWRLRDLASVLPGWTFLTIQYVRIRLRHA